MEISRHSHAMVTEWDARWRWRWRWSCEVVGGGNWNGTAVVAMQNANCETAKIAKCKIAQCKMQTASETTRRTNKHQTPNTHKTLNKKKAEKKKKKKMRRKVRAKSIAAHKKKRKQNETEKKERKQKKKHKKKKKKPKERKQQKKKKKKKNTTTYVELDEVNDAVPLEGPVEVPELPVDLHVGLFLHQLLFGVGYGRVHPVPLARVPHVGDHAILGQRVGDALGDLHRGGFPRNGLALVPHFAVGHGHRDGLVRERGDAGFVVGLVVVVSQWKKERKNGTKREQRNREFASSSSSEMQHKSRVESN